MEGSFPTRIRSTVISFLCKSHSLIVTDCKLVRHYFGRLFFKFGTFSYNNELSDKLLPRYVHYDLNYNYARYGNYDKILLSYSGCSTRLYCEPEKTFQVKFTL